MNLEEVNKDYHLLKLVNRMGDAVNVSKDIFNLVLKSIVYFTGIVTKAFSDFHDHEVSLQD